MARRTRFTHFAFALATTLVVSRAAGAEPLDPTAMRTLDPAAARALFTEGRELLEQGEYERACEKFDASQRLSPGAGTLFNLAGCWQKLGRTATAWARFLDAASFAHQSKQPDREQEARRRAAQLEPTLARMTISVSNPAAGLRLSRDGIPLDRGAWGSDLPIDPGAHEITAVAPGRRGFFRKLVVRDGESAAVEIPELAVEPEQQALTRTEATRPETVRPPIAPAERPKPPRATVGHSVGWALIGAGIGLTGGGIAFAIAARSSNQSALAKCSPDGACESESERAEHELFVQDARRWRTMAMTSFGVATAAVAGGVVLVLSSGPDPRRPVLALRVNANTIDLRGHW